MLYIAQSRFLIPFVLSFIFAYTLGYAKMVGAISAPAMHYYLPCFTCEDEAWVDPIVLYEESEAIEETQVEKSTEAIEEIQVEDGTEVKTIDIADYTSFPDPKGDGSYESYRELLEFISTITDVDLTLLATIVATESGFRAYATPGGDNSAKGLFQFIDTTWIEVVRKHGNKFGVTEDVSPFDPKANAIMGAMHVKDIIDRFGEKEVKAVDIYLVHFLGPTGAKKFLKAPEHKVAAEHMPRAAKRNKNIFFDNKKPLTIKEVYASLDDRLVQKTMEFNIN